MISYTTGIFFFLSSEFCLVTFDSLALRWLCCVVLCCNVFLWLFLDSQAMPTRAVLVALRWIECCCVMSESTRPRTRTSTLLSV